MTEANRFQVPPAELTAVQVERAEQMPTITEHRRASSPGPWSGHMATAPDGGGPGDVDGE